tara:strand:- start:250 stop:489 length:240 start_codon:yes stop_codon:yes gene_type:complete
MGLFTDCAYGKYCQQDNFVDSELNEEKICDACVAVASYIEGLAKEKDKLEPCPKCGNKTFLYDQDGDPVYCKECLFHVG